jgi:hypothetical protein
VITGGGACCDRTSAPIIGAVSIFGCVGEFEPAHDIDGVIVWLDLGGLVSVAAMDLIPAIEARRGVFSARHQAKLCTIEGGTCHNAASSVRADGLFRFNKIRGFLDQIAVSAPRNRSYTRGGRRAADCRSSASSRARRQHTASDSAADNTPAAKRIAQILDSRREL